MASSEKLMHRFRSQPSDFKWNEMVRLLRHLGYTEYDGSGSRKCFRGEGLPQIRLHRPHPKPIMPKYAVKQVFELLNEAELI